MTADQRMATLQEQLDSPLLWSVYVPLTFLACAVGAFIVYLLFRFLPDEDPPELTRARWNGLDVILGIVFWLLLQFCVGSIASALPQIMGQPEPSADSAQLHAMRYALLLVVNLLCFCFLLLFPIVKYQQGPDGFGLQWARFRGGIWKGLCFYVVTTPGLIGLSSLWILFLVSQGGDASEQASVEQFRALVRSEEVLGVSIIAATAVIGAPLLEEILFRGLLFRWLEKTVGAPLGIVVSGLLFGAIHLSPIAIVPTFLLGMLLALIYHRTKNLWTCIFFHAYFNGVQLIIAAVVKP